MKKLKEWLAYRWIPKCKHCDRPLDRDRVCWYHTP